jgi:hypothetical protein
MPWLCYTPRERVPSTHYIGGGWAPEPVWMQGLATNNVLTQINAMFISLENNFVAMQ